MVDLKHLEQDEWREVIGEEEEATLEHVVRAGSGLALGYLRNAQSELWMLREVGTERQMIPIGAMKTLAGLSGSPDSANVFFSLESFVQPPSIYRYSLGDGSPSVWQKPPLGGEAAAALDDGITERQIWYTSKDGTRISMFLVHGEGVPQDGQQRLLLHGYGGFNISKVPIFDRGFYTWVQSGGVFALPNLRGGGEYGEAWHEDGMLDRKQNVFDDYIAAAEYLIGESYTSPAKLAIFGRSNGGLLVGAAMTQRPDLYRAVVCQVPLLDMLRYHQFLIARLWIPEYGSADNPDQFQWLYEYSPYHHVGADVEYPAVLFMAAESDSRVDPLHARKMAALMQSEAKARGPILVEIESEAGHGVGKPVHMLVEQLTDQYSFLWWQLGAEPSA